MIKEYDVIVCGAGSSGMIAAIAAARNNAKVLLIEKYSMLGGTNVVSLVAPLMTFHSGQNQIVRGIPDEIISRLKTRDDSFGHIDDPIGFASSITPIDIEGLKQLYFDLIDEEENIDLLLHTFISGVVMEDGQITGIKCVNKSGHLEFKAKVIIDATGDGDVAALANAQYVIGREQDNLCQPMTLLFTMGNVDFNKVIDYMKNNADDFDMREGYDYKYLAASGFFSKIKAAVERNEFTISRDRVLFFENVRKNEVSVNMTRVARKLGIDTFMLTEAEREGRRQLAEAVTFLKKYIPGFEESYLVYSATGIGIRETRHIVGLYTLDVNDILESRSFDDSIAVGSFPIDIHSPSGANLELFDEPENNSYEIPYRVMLPKGIEGLIVTGRAISATHEASASARVSPVAMALGQAAGTSAALASKDNVVPSKLDIKLLQETLEKQNHVIRKPVK